MKNKPSNQTTMDAPERAEQEPAAVADEPAPEAPAATEEAGPDELEFLRDQLMRRTAEFQNYRRRTDQEKAFMLEIGKAQVLQGMLEVLDDLERSLEATVQVAEQEGDVPGPAYQSLREGLDLVYQKFLGQLERLGVERIEATGQPFDEAVHEAVMQQPAPDDTPAGTILQELQRGYRMGDRVLRHAKVIVAA